jgi:CIC family chloride channel protein
MPAVISAVGLRFRLTITRAMTRLGMGENSILLPLALIVGVITGAAAVGFHELINLLRDLLYRHFPAGFLYGKGIWLLIVLPTGGGLLVGLIVVYISRSREGHGVVDVMESVMRNSGIIKPGSAIEKILTSAITIGSGGSAGAEGPIVQIGAAIASGVGMLFQVARAQMPVLIGCGSAAGISAIFDAPIGGVLFTLEIILLDFSVSAFAPVVLASVISNVTSRALLVHFHHLDPHSNAAIFQVPAKIADDIALLGWASIPNFVVLGLICGFAGVAMTKLMYGMDEFFHHRPIPRALRPAAGGAALGIIGVLYVVAFGWFILGRPKPIDFAHYPMPAFYGDGYGAVQQLFGTNFYAQFDFWHLMMLLAFLSLAKIVGSCLTLASGGSGGIIAPSLFLGGTTGALVGVLLQRLGLNADVPPGLYALIGMGAVLAAVVHAPLASILILVEVTDRHNIILPAMLATIAATGTARLVFPDSVYTLTLRQRGVRVGSGSDLSLLRRLIVEQVPLEPVTAIPVSAPFERLAELEESTGATDFVVTNADGEYAGMETAGDIQTTLLQRDAIPLLLVRDLVRPELPCVQITDDLASVMETFSRFEVARLPVCLKGRPGRVVGLISRRALMNQYHQALTSS